MGWCKMSNHWYTFEDVMEDNSEGICRVSKQKIPTCAFAQLRPGDIIGVTHTYEKRAGEFYNAGTLFVKVVSVKMPVARSFFSAGDPGNVLVQLPNGEETELLSWDPRSWPSGICYFPTPQIYAYFRENCEMDSSYVDLSRLIIYVGHEATLREDMLAEKERREKVRRARIEKYAEQEDQRREEAEKDARAQVENDAAKEVLDELFDSLNEMEFRDFICPECGSVCSVPVRGKNVWIHCRCNHDFEVFC